MPNADVIVIGAGLSGLVAAAEAADAGRSVIVLDQEPAASLGGQAWWSFGGLFLVDSPEQRRLGIRDSAELALADWLGTAGFDRPEDHWPREWAHAYVDFAAGEKRSWLRQQGIGLFPVVQWAERGGYQAGGHGNSVPRFHVTWGTGPAVLTPFVRRVMEHVRAGRVSLRFRHRVTELVTDAGVVAGVTGQVLEPSDAGRGEPSSRAGKGPTPAVQAFLDRGEDFLTAPTVAELVGKMNELVGADLVDADEVQRTIVLRDGQVRTGLGKDPQVTAIAAARHYIGDRTMRTVAPHEFLDPAAGPLIAVRLHILTRKTLGGLETDLSSRVLASGGSPVPGLYAAGEVAGFGGGGMHGYRALEGTFLGGCLFSGRTAGRAAARDVA
jgi:predicted oxidoreductase